MDRVAAQLRAGQIAAAAFQPASADRRRHPFAPALAVLVVLEQRVEGAQRDVVLDGDRTRAEVGIRQVLLDEGVDPAQQHMCPRLRRCPRLGAELLDHARGGQFHRHAAEPAQVLGPAVGAVAGQGDQELGQDRTHARGAVHAPGEEPVDLLGGQRHPCLGYLEDESLHITAVEPRTGLVRKGGVPQHHVPGAQFRLTTALRVPRGTPGHQPELVLLRIPAADQRRGAP